VAGIPRLDLGSTSLRKLAGMVGRLCYKYDQNSRAPSKASRLPQHDRITWTRKPRSNEAVRTQVKEALPVARLNGLKTNSKKQKKDS
jgi:hypothetical protein